MDPNQQRRDACKICGGRLPKRKSKFCSDLCARTMNRRKRDQRNPRYSERAQFLQQVSDPIWLNADDAVAIASAEALLTSGAVIGLRLDGRLHAIGVPIEPGQKNFLQLLAMERRRRLPAVRHAENAAKRDDERAARRARRQAKKVA